MALIANLTSNTSTPGFSAGDGNEVILVVEGTFDSGTATIQIQGTSGNWVDLVDGSGTAAFAKRVFSANGELRVNLTGATSPDLNVSAFPAK